MSACDEQTEKANEFLKKISPRYNKDELGLIEKALDLSRSAHKGQLRMSGEPHFYHSLEVAKTLYDLRMDCSSLCAGLLHDVLEDTSEEYSHLESEFPAPIPQLVEGVTKYPPFISSQPEKNSPKT